MPDPEHPPESRPPPIETPPLLPPAPAPECRPWGLWATVGWSALIGFAMLMVQGAVFVGYGYVVSTATGKEMSDPRTLSENGLALSLATILSAPVVLSLCILFASFRRICSVGEYLALRVPPLRVVFKWVGCFVLFAIITDLVTIMMGRSIVPDFMVRAIQTAVIPPLLWLAVVVAAPISEEFLFRGFIFAGLYHSRLRATGAILITSLVWTVIHQQYDFLQLLWIFIAGILLGIARVKTGSMLLCIVLHAFMNFIATVEAIIHMART